MHRRAAARQWREKACYTLYMSAEGKPQNYWHGDTDDKAMDEPGLSETPSLPEDDTEIIVNWSASEYISPDKGFWWYIALIAVALALIALDIFYMRSWTFTALVVVMTVAIIVFSARPPRTIQYTLSGEHGLYVGEKLYHLSEFKAFGLIQDDQNLSIMLIPTKRFSPGVSVYFPEEAADKILNILGNRLPMERLKLDFIDQIVRRLRL